MQRSREISGKGDGGGRDERDEAITRSVNAPSEKWREMMKPTPYGDRERER